MTSPSRSNGSDPSFYIRVGTRWAAWDRTTRTSPREVDVATYPDLEEAKMDAITMCLQTRQVVSVGVWHPSSAPAGVLSTFSVVFQVESET